MENKEFVEIELSEKIVENNTGCFDGCQRHKGSPTGG